MKASLKKCLPLFVLLAPLASHASLPPIDYTVTPIIGLERAVVTRPDIHVTTRLIYGALVTAGYRAIALEAELREEKLKWTLARPQRPELRARASASDAPEALRRAWLYTGANQVPARKPADSARR